MRSLGVNPTASTIWLAYAENGQLRATDPYCLSLPPGLESGEQLIGLLDECHRVLRDLSPEKVVVLDPEPNAKFQFSSVRERLTGETLLLLAAAQADIPCERLSRASVRSNLDLGRAGKLASLVEEVVDSPLSPHWKNKRDLAALAALAVQTGRPDA